MIDLHIHSTYSDGSYFPNEIVKMCIDCNIHVISITDHDTIQAYSNIDDWSSYKIQVIPGIELGLGRQDSCHILGYGFDLKSPVMNAACDKIKKRRMAEMIQIFRLLNKNKISISMKDITTKYSSGLNLGNIIAELIEKHYVRNKKDAYDKFFGVGKIAHIEFFNYTPEEKIRIIKDSGGIAILAHPYQLGLEDQELEKRIVELADLGLDGVEAYHSGQTIEIERLLLKLAQKYHLIVTGGSDYHGKLKPNVKLGTIYNDRVIPDDIIKQGGFVDDKYDI